MKRILPLLALMLFCFHLKAYSNEHLSTTNQRLETAKELDLSIETHSAQTIIKSSNISKLDTFDSGHHKTIIRVHNLPKESSFTIICERPLLNNSITENDFTREILLNNADLIGESTPSIFISGRGYLPGEPVIVTIQDKKSHFCSKPITLHPHPLKIGSKYDNALLSAELKDITLTRYEIIPENFKKNERLIMESFSIGEQMRNELFCSHEFRIGITPGVIGVEGSTAMLMITRSNGEKLCLPLPWGTEFKKYASGDSCPPTKNFPSEFFNTSNY